LKEPCNLIPLVEEFMIRAFTVLLVAGLSTALLPATPDDNVVFRSDVSLVRVDARVVDESNRAISGLTAADFVLYEEGQPQPIRSFGSEDMPVDVLFLLDVSASMGPHVQRIADASRHALKVLGKDDRMGIMVFDRSTRVLLPFSTNREDVHQAFDRLLRDEQFNGGTDITRAIVDAADYIHREGRRDARRAIVILTDDQTELDRDDVAVMRALARADTVLCALIAPDALHSGQATAVDPFGVFGADLKRLFGEQFSRAFRTMTKPRTSSAGTSEIAQDSGGDSISVNDASALQETLARIRQRYALFFNLPDGVEPGQERNIEVVLTPAALQRYPHAQVRYRRVYMTPESGPASSSPSPVAEAARTLHQLHPPPPMNYSQSGSTFSN
jgi:VWFA-related protein